MDLKQQKVSVDSTDTMVSSVLRQGLGFSFGKIQAQIFCGCMQQVMSGVARCATTIHVGERKTAIWAGTVAWETKSKTMFNVVKTGSTDVGESPEMRRRGGEMERQSR